MGVTKTILAEGNGPIPKKGDSVTIEYTGYLKDPSKPDQKGDKYVVASLKLFPLQITSAETDICSLQIRFLRRSWCF